MEPVQYLKAFRRRWWVVLAAVVVATASAWVTTKTVTASPRGTSAPTYSGTTVLWDPGVPTAGAGSPITNLDTLAQVVTLPDVSAAAAKLMHYPGDPLQLGSQVSASADKTSGFLRITAVAEDAKTAEVIPTAFSHALIAYLNDLKIKSLNEREHLVQGMIEASRAEGLGPDVVASLQGALSQIALDRTTPVTLSIIQQAKAEAVPPQGFQAPQSRRSRLLIAALIGLLAGLALALVLERFDTRIRSSNAAEEAFGVPVLAEVPAIIRRRRKGVVLASHPLSRAADAFRLVEAGTARWGPNESEADENGNHTAATILITSPEARDGKTTVAANLAVAYAQGGAASSSCRAIFAAPPSTTRSTSQGPPASSMRSPR